MDAAVTSSLSEWTEPVEGDHSLPGGELLTSQGREAGFMWESVCPKGGVFERSCGSVLSLTG